MNSLFSLPLPAGPRDAVYWRDVHGAAAGLALVQAADEAPGPVLAVCESGELAETMLRELRYFASGAEDAAPVLGLPDWETLPYDGFSPHQDIVSERLATLARLPDLRRGVVVLSATTLMHRLPPAPYIAGNSLDLRTGQSVDIGGMRERMVQAGYRVTDSVMEHGEIAVRGSIIDIFPMGSDVPLRIDLFDEQIDSIRTFDPETQRSGGETDAVRMLPGREYPLDAAGVKAFRRRFAERFDIDPRQCPLHQDVASGIDSPGLEYYLALFFDSPGTTFDFLPEDAVVCAVGDLRAAAGRFWESVESRHQECLIDRYRPVLPPREVFLEPGEMLARIGERRRIEIRDHPDAASLHCAPLPDLSADVRLQKPFSRLRRFMKAEGGRVAFCAESAGRRQNLLELLRQHGIRPALMDHWRDFAAGAEPAALLAAPLDRGFRMPRRGVALVAEAQLFGERVAQRRRRRKVQDNTEFIVRSLAELRIGDAVVHIDHGIGRYQGLKTIATDGQAGEFLVIRYADDAILYVPVAALRLVSRYSGPDQDNVPINRLGTEQWRKVRRKAAERIRDVAAELLDIHARRAARPGRACRPDREELDRFAAGFPFEETADQAAAIDAVLEDMAAERAMDRLICGDVGFGKTEVAMRAAFVAAGSGRQTVALVPTTLLAQQHCDSFRDRFADWPFIVEVISRFKSAGRQAAVLEDFKKGKIDILIGTHKLLHAPLDFKNIGLLVIDEEHRFGVRQKEKLKSLRADVDILTLTATPIPRTLNMALSGMRDLSLIASPPARRLSIKTFVREHQDSLVKEAVSRELLRGGQAFYLHNDVKTIGRAAERLEAIVPEARIAVAHGQMRERELERVMANFYHKRFNVLVCTTIIETGIDIPSANTIVISRADRFGLAQLHQLRGRVGRSHHQAYAYLLLSGDARLRRDARKRIEALQAASALGAGFTLASRDLEIRGAGELLGDEQSGHIQKIGFSLYTEMLEEAVAAIRDGRTPPPDLAAAAATEINLRVPALIPDDYLPDVHMRLVMYKRIASAGGADELEELKAEMIDRFGPLPAPLGLLLRQTRLQARARQLGIRKIDAGADAGRVEFAPQTPVDPLSLVRLVQSEPERYQLSGGGRLHFTHRCDTADGKVEFVDRLLDRIRPDERRAA